MESSRIFMISTKMKAKIACVPKTRNCVSIDSQTGSLLKLNERMNLFCIMLQIDMNTIYETILRQTSIWSLAVTFLDVVIMKINS